MFWTRLRSGILLVVIAIALIVLGGNVLLVSFGILSIIGLYELYRAANIASRKITYIGYGITILYYLYLGFYHNDEMFSLAIIIFALICVLGYYVLTFPAYHINQMLIVFFGIVYVSVLLSYIYRIRLLDNGILVWLAFLCSWGCDTCAYCVGMLIGRHKMAPILSPKKSIEGAVGGVVGAVILGAVFGQILLQEVFQYPAIICGMICGVGALISMIGDLAASAIKRNYQIKDYGTLIPGHGGILDRFDSVIFTAPVIYYTILFFMK